MPYKVAPGRSQPTAAIRGVTSSAGGCGVKDQVSRSRLTAGAGRAPGGRHVSLVGPTATGKTAAAVRFARRHGGVELISVDAIAVYRELDVGTAKPTPEERRGVAWHLVDECDPGEEFSVARFQAARARCDRRDRGAGPPRRPRRGDGPLSPGRRRRARPARALPGDRRRARR